MFKEFNGDHDQHPDILDRAAITRPQAKSWNWRLTMLVCFLALGGFLGVVAGGWLVF